MKKNTYRTSQKGAEVLARRRDLQRVMAFCHYTRELEIEIEIRRGCRRRVHGLFRSGYTWTGMMSSNQICTKSPPHCCPNFPDTSLQDPQRRWFVIERPTVRVHPNLLQHMSVVLSQTWATVSHSACRSTLPIARGNPA